MSRVELLGDGDDVDVLSVAEAFDDGAGLVGGGVVEEGDEGGAVAGGAGGDADDGAGGVALIGELNAAIEIEAGLKVWASRGRTARIRGRLPR